MSCQGIDSGEMRHRITVMNYTGSKDAIGSPRTNYTVFFRTNAKVEYRAAVEVEKATRETDMTTVLFTIRKRDGLDTKMVVGFEGEAYNILSILKRSNKQILLIKAVHTPSLKIEIPMVAEIKLYAGLAAPSGYVLCDGASYPTATYPDLFNVINYDFGGSGASFNVPDLRGRAAIGIGTGAGLTARALGDEVGAETHALTEEELASHTHTKNTSVITGNIRIGGNTSPATTKEYNDNYFGEATGTSNIFNSAGVQAGEYMALDAVSHTLALSTLTLNNTGSGTTHNNMQPSIAINYIIAVI